MDNVYVKNISMPYKYFRNDECPYTAKLTDAEKELIVRKTVKNADDLYNGTTVRLNGIIEFNDCYEFSISKLTYFDSLVSNILYHKYNNKINSLDKDDHIENLIMSKLNDIVDNGIDTFDKILSNANLANTLAVSVLVRDINGDYGLVHRTKNVAVGAGLLSVTVTGSLDDIDYQSDDPILSCVKREVDEELGLSLKNSKVEYIAISKTKLQPIVIVNSDIDDKWINIIPQLTDAKDYSKEISKFCVVSKDDLENMLIGTQMTDAASFHLRNVIFHTNLDQ